MAVAQLWMVSLGCEAEVQEQQQEPGAILPEAHIAHLRRKRPAGAAPPRGLSCVVRGRLVLLASVLQGQEIIPDGILEPEAWPHTLQAPCKLPSASQQRERERRRKYKREGRARKQAAA